ncbi:hypothetical protein V9T40_004886 [Parthenolecanium corni]|uniref:WW domain-containing oxidoreductase n=1 Tax=Parthenolecanium corni TaxID=536013 RepID=A0AAN9Y3Q0_9HEMI
MLDSDSGDELPVGWEERATVDGNIYFVNHTTKSTQWIHPRTGKKKYVRKELPFGWKKIVKPNGEIVFQHESDEMTTNSDPRLAFAQEYGDNPSEVRYKFDASSTTDEVLHGLDLSNKIAIVTGANTGIGLETATSLAMHDCHVIMACRSISRAEEAAEKIRLKRRNAHCDLMKLNLSSLKSVKEFAETFKSKYNKLDILILNAGVFSPPYWLTEDGYESTFQICHLSHFYLTNLLEDKLVLSDDPRVVILASESHRFSLLNENTLSELALSPPADQYSGYIAYNNAKLCNLLFAHELHMRWYCKGVTVFAVHPGNLVYSDLSRHWWLYRLLFFIVRPFTKSLQQAASTSIFCATSPYLKQKPVLYFNNCFPCTPSQKAMDANMSRKLWKLSEKMTNEALLRLNLSAFFS